MTGVGRGITKEGQTYHIMYNNIIIISNSQFVRSSRWAETASLVYRYKYMSYSCTLCCTCMYGRVLVPCSCRCMWLKSMHSRPAAPSSAHVLCCTLYITVQLRIIGVSLSKPHTNQCYEKTAVLMYVCMHVCMYVCRDTSNTCCTIKRPQLVSNLCQD